MTQFLSSPAVAMECLGERVSGAAKRRRERRLRQWHRYERLTVQMALCEALHHAAPQVERGENSAPRGLKTHKAGGRPGVLKEPEPQEAVTVGYVAAGVPLLVVASLAGGDVVDVTALRFLVKEALDRQKEEEEEQAKVKRQEEEERRMQRINAKVSNDFPLTQEERQAWRRWILAYDSSSSSSGKRRKRKKRRKRWLPKSSSRSSSGCGRSCDHQRRVPAVQEVRVHGALDSVHRRRLDILVVQQRQVRGFMVQKTVVVPQLQFIFGRRHSCRTADANPHGPVCSAADHGDSAVAASFGSRCPCCASRAGSQVLPWRRPWRSHSFSSLSNQTLSTTLRIWQ